MLAAIGATLGVIATVAIILAIDVIFGETIWALAFGIACLIGIPAWVIWDNR